MKISDIIFENDLIIGDSFDIELGDTVIQTGIVGLMEDGVIIESDKKSLVLLKEHGATFEHINKTLEESYATEVDVLFRNLANGVEDIQEILYDPQDSAERYVSQKLKDMYQDVLVDYELDPDIDQEKIINILRSRIENTYGNDQDRLSEAEYQGRKVPLGKPMRGDVKKSKVYVRGPKGNVVKVNFGDPNMKIKKSNPKRRKSFRARHNCDNPGPRWRARYWACRSW
jgi:hypothetical protein